ncbi:MAG: hypothetical protein M1819_001723 [Sarea resinae]|nr:MAG: hypothetical protein M1819_001723 [Sarea resinae]
MSLADYLAKNYLTADTPQEKKTKKRKRKGTAAPTATANNTSSGLIIADDDAGWGSNPTVNDDEDGPAIVSGSSAEFRKRKTSSWRTVGAPAPSNSDQAAADAILAATAAETSHNNNNNGAGDPDDEAPQVEDADNVLQMESGAHAGLQSADQVTAALKKRQAEERRRFEAEGAEKSGRGQETIYRDASGRIINVAMKRAEARRKMEEEEAKKAAELEAQKGDVQRAAREKRTKELKDAKYLGVSRYADDAELNEELREQDRWNDPAAQFLSAKKKGKSITGKPLYQGAAPPNRYGIRPGYRWDGVDRSNAFEKEYFAAQNRRRNLKELDYAWQMDE